MDNGSLLFVRVDRVTVVYVYRLWVGLCFESISSFRTVLATSLIGFGIHINGKVASVTD